MRKSNIRKRAIIAKFIEYVEDPNDLGIMHLHDTPDQQQSSNVDLGVNLHYEARRLRDIPKDLIKLSKRESGKKIMFECSGSPDEHTLDICIGTCVDILTMAFMSSCKNGKYTLKQTLSRVDNFINALRVAIVIASFKLDPVASVDVVKDAMAKQMADIVITQLKEEQFELGGEKKGKPN